jgi:hypothetical protein
MALAADDDPALGEEFLDVPKAEMKAEVEPDGVGDHLGRESVATVWGPWVSKPAEHGVSYPPLNLTSPFMLDPSARLSGCHKARHVSAYPCC